MAALHRAGNPLKKLFLAYGLSLATLASAEARAEQSRQKTISEIQTNPKGYANSSRGTGTASPAFVGKDEGGQRRASPQPTSEGVAPTTSSSVNSDPALTQDGDPNQPKKSAAENPFSVPESEQFANQKTESNSRVSGGSGGSESNEEGDGRNGTNQNDPVLRGYDERLNKLAKQRSLQQQSDQTELGAVASITRGKTDLLRKMMKKRIRKWIFDGLAAVFDGAAVGVLLHAYSRKLGWEIREMPAKAAKTDRNAKEAAKKINEKTTASVEEITKEEQRIRQERRQYLESQQS